MNNKGFTVVELISSFALTMVITVFLFEVLIEVKDIFVETSLKTNIEEKLSVISKNIKYKVNDSTVVNESIISFDTNNVVVVGDQKYKMPDGVSIKEPSVKLRCSNKCLKVSFKLTSEELSKDYEYNTVFYVKD